MEEEIFLIFGVCRKSAFKELLQNYIRPIIFGMAVPLNTDITFIYCLLQRHKNLPKWRERGIEWYRRSFDRVISAVDRGPRTQAWGRSYERYWARWQSRTTHPTRSPDHSASKRTELQQRNSRNLTVWNMQNCRNRSKLQIYTASLL